MTRIVFDIEADGLLNTVSHMWILYTYNLDTKEEKYWLEGETGWEEYFNSASCVIGHNILGYDLSVLQKLFNYTLPKNVKAFDTLLISQILDFKRFDNDGHSLERWGVFLNSPKISYDDFTQYTEEMKIYCRQDTLLTARVYNILMKELKLVGTDKLKNYIKAEHAAAEWARRANLHGWPFDFDKAIELYDTLDTELEEIKAVLTPRLGMKCVAVDKKKGIIEEKYPKWTKEGCYAASTASWFDINPWSGFEGEERPIEGPYSRVTFKHLTLDSSDDVKTFLFRQGWQPTEWNFRKDEDGKRRQTSPKITEDSLELLGGDGKLYADFTTIKSRHGVLKTWIENVDDNGRLHGDFFSIGTPSMRARHNIIVNVPGTDSKYGPEMRKLFKALPGWKIIGCDSSGNQARGLAHYLENEKYIKLILEGDVHQSNADKLTEVLLDMHVVYQVQRSQAKRIFYAFLFGASGEKLWSYIFGVLDKESGKILKNGFIKAVPGFKDLLDKLEGTFAKTRKYGNGYIYSIADNKIYCDSFHKLLVYLLQACEKITCSTAIMLTMENLEKENIPYIPLIYYHDENEFMVPEEYAERAAQIGKEAYRDGPKIYGIDIMDGSGKVGDTWYDVH